MKYPVKILLLLFLPLFCLGQDVHLNFSPGISVSGSGNGYTRPRLALVHDSIPVISWTNTSNNRIYFSRKTSTGFTVPLPVTPSGLSVYTSNDEGGAMDAAGDTVFIVFFVLPGKVYGVRSTDGGVTWSDTIPVSRQYPLNAYTPDVVLLPGGNPVVTYEISNSNYSYTGIVSTRSADGGDTWLAEVIADTTVNGSPCECCPPGIAVKDTTFFIGYRNNLNNRRNIHIVSSYDSGSSFASYTEIDTTNWIISTCPVAGPAMEIIEDSLCVFWKSSNHIYYNNMSLAGAMNEVRKLIPGAPSNVIQRHPAVSGKNDTLVVVWDDNQNGNRDCFVKVGVNGLNSLGTTQLINDSAAANFSGTQICPDVAYSNGIFHFVYNDQTEVRYTSARIDGIVNVQQQVHEDRIELYPNPSEHVVNVEGVEGALYSIYDASGSCVIEGGIVHSGSIDISELSSGIYFIRIQSVNQIKTFKLIKI